MWSFFKSKENSADTINSVYYRRENYIVEDADLIAALNPDHVEGRRNCQGEIRVKSLPLIDLSQKQIIASLKKPDFIYDNSQTIKGHKVLFYKEDVEFYRFLLQFHFIDNEFFLASNKVIAPGLLPEAEKRKIINQLSSRYFPGEEINTNSFIMNFTDSAGNMLYTIDEVYFFVNYIPGGDVRERVLRKFASSGLDNNKSGFENTLDKYF